MTELINTLFGEPLASVRGRLGLSQIRARGGVRSRRISNRRGEAGRGPDWRCYVLAVCAVQLAIVCEDGTVPSFLPASLFLVLWWQRPQLWLARRPTVAGQMLAVSAGHGLEHHPGGSQKAATARARRRAASFIQHQGLTEPELGFLKARELPLILDLPGHRRYFNKPRRVYPMLSRSETCFLSAIFYKLKDDAEVIPGAAGHMSRPACLLVCGF